MCYSYVLYEFFDPYLPEHNARTIRAPLRATGCFCAGVQPLGAGSAGVACVESGHPSPLALPFASRAVPGFRIANGLQRDLRRFKGGAPCLPAPQKPLQPGRPGGVRPCRYYDSQTTAQCILTGTP